MKNMYKKIHEELCRKKPVILLSLYKTSGSTPRKEGAKMACFINGDTAGTIGGGAIEYECTKLCKEKTEADFPFTKTYTLKNNTAGELGMVCGGTADIFFQFLSPDDYTISLFKKITDVFEKNTKAWLITDLLSSKLELCTENSKNFDEKAITNHPVLSKDEKLYFEPLVSGATVYVFGGGHVSQALCKILSLTDFSVVIYEENENFCKKSLFHDAKRIIKADFQKINENINIKENDYAVVLTRGHLSDNEVLSQIMHKHPSYLGVIGSKKKVGVMKEYLKNCGFNKNEIEHIHSPIGLSIGAVTPFEIAVSITAELIYHRNAKIK